MTESEIEKKVSLYSQHERIMRLIEINCKRTIVSIDEIHEIKYIQKIRLENGEIEAVIKMRKFVDTFDSEQYN